MYIIKKFENFLQKLNELDAAGTYLDQKNFKREPTIKPNQDTTITRKKFGKLFAQAPITANKSWGLKFVENGSQYGGTRYKVIFSEEFMEFFEPRTPKQFTKTTNKFEEPGSSFRRNTELKFDRSAVRDPNQVSKEISPKTNITKPGNKINWKELNDVNIIAMRGNGFNRTHFLPGIPNQFKGIGLGYVVYEEFIKFLGYASSNQSASKEARKVWSQIIQDPDFYAIVIKDGADDGAVFVVHKDCNLPGVDIIIENWIDDLKRQSYVPFNVGPENLLVDDNIYKKYPKLAEAWKPENILKLKNMIQLITDSLISGNNTQFDEIVKFAIDNRFNSNKEQEKVIVKNIIEDLESNSNKFELYKKAFEKLLSSSIISFDSLNAVNIKKDLRLKLTEYLFEKLRNKKGARKLGKLLEESKLKKEIISTGRDLIENPVERLEYYHSNKEEDCDNSIEWINNFKFTNVEDYAIIILFIYLSNNKKEIFEKINKKITDKMLELLLEYMERDNKLLFAEEEELEKIKTDGSIELKFANDDLTIENSVKFYQFIINYIEDKDKKELIQEFLDKAPKN